MQNSLNKAVRWLVITALPFFLTLIILRLMIIWDWPNYPTFEYGRIAADRFGFSDQERLELATATLDYLRMDEPADEAIEELKALTLPNSNQPLYNDREISHMYDVKWLVDLFRIIMWVLAFIVVGGFLFLILRSGGAGHALLYGGLVTAGILLVVALLILVSWNFIFVQFHEILFPPDSWSFAYSDSLIRLFPEQFWFDFGLIWTGGILLSGVIIGLIGWRLTRRPA